MCLDKCKGRITDLVQYKTSSWHEIVYFTYTNMYSVKKRRWVTYRNINTKKLQSQYKILSSR